jgi:hypothetical protein
VGQRAERPVARTTGLVVKTLADEVLVYDLERHRAHSLNGVAATVWRRCDGTRTATEIANAIRATGVPVSVDAVRYAFDELARARLLTHPIAAEGITRRELMRRLGATAAALPLVTSIVAPTAADAQSACFQPDRTTVVACLGGTPCCAPGVCTVVSGTSRVCCIPDSQPCAVNDDCCPSLVCSQGTCVI